MEDGIKIDVDFGYIAAAALVMWLWTFDGVSLGRAVVYHLTDGAISLQSSEATK